MKLAIAGDDARTLSKRKRGEEANDEVVRARSHRDESVAVIEQLGIAALHTLGFRESTRPLFIHPLGGVEPGLALAVEAAIGPGLM